MKVVFRGTWSRTLRAFSTGGKADDFGLKKKLDKEEIMKKLSRVSRAKEVKKRLAEAIASGANAKVGEMDQETNMKILEELIGGYQFDTDQNEYLKLIERMKQLKEEEDAKAKRGD
jgi:hypothetical protein